MEKRETSIWSLCRERESRWLQNLKETLLDTYKRKNSPHVSRLYFRAGHYFARPYYNFIFILYHYTHQHILLPLVVSSDHIRSLLTLM